MNFVHFYYSGGRILIPRSYFNFQRWNFWKKKMRMCIFKNSILPSFSSADTLTSSPHFIFLNALKIDKIWPLKVNSSLGIRLPPIDYKLSELGDHFLKVLLLLYSLKLQEKVVLCVTPSEWGQSLNWAMLRESKQYDCEAVTRAVCAADRLRSTATSSFTSAEGSCHEDKWQIRGFICSLWWILPADGCFFRLSRGDTH